MAGPARRTAAHVATPITWRTPLRVLLRFGLPLAGVALILRCFVLSIGGDISRIGFACGVLLILASVSARLVPGR